MSLPERPLFNSIQIYHLIFGEARIITFPKITISCKAYA